MEVRRRAGVRRREGVEGVGVQGARGQARAREGERSTCLSGGSSGSAGCGTLTMSAPPCRTHAWLGRYAVVGGRAGGQVGRWEVGRYMGRIDREGGREAGRQGGRAAGRQEGREAGRQGGRQTPHLHGRELARLEIHAEQQHVDRQEGARIERDARLAAQLEQRCCGAAVRRGERLLWLPLWLPGCTVGRGGVWRAGAAWGEPHRT